MRRAVLLLPLTVALACSSSPSSSGSLGGGGGATGPAGLCTSRGFCWESIAPQGNPLKGVWGSSSSDVWAVGDAGTLLHSDGRTWSMVDSGVAANLRAVSGRAAGDVWAVGSGGTALHFDGTAWTAFPAPVTESLAAVWVGTEVWAVADAPYHVLRWSGSRWEVKDAPPISPVTIWGSSPTDIYVGGWSSAGGTMLRHWDGTAFSSVSIPTTEGVHGISGTGPNDVWVSGGYLDFLHWDGTAWTKLSPVPCYFPRQVFAASPSDVWLACETSVAVHWNGTSWTSAPGAPTVAAGIWGGATGAWAVGTNGRTWKYDGTQWTDERSLLFNEDMHDVTSMFGAGAEVFFTGDGTFLWQRDASGWKELLPPVDYMPSAGWASSAGDLWLGGDFPVRVVAGTPTAMTTTPWGGATDMHGSGPSDVWAVGGPYGYNLAHWNGTTWTPYDIATMAVRRVFAISPTNAWAAGWGATNDAGVVARWDGSSWTTTTTSSPNRLQGVWAAAANDVWIAGYRGVLFHWDGSTLSSVASGTTSDLYAVWGRASNDVFAAGAGGTLLHYDGSLWQPVPTGCANGIFDLWVTSTDLWLLGYPHTILHKVR